MSEPILYLMSKYSGREADSLKENQDAWLALHQKGYLVYSPICESHNIEERRQCLHICPKCKTKKLFWNMRLRNDQSICSDCGQIYKDKDLIEEYKEPDYVARDLQFIEKLSDKNGQEEITYNECPHHGVCEVDDQKRCLHHLWGESRSSYVYGKTCMAPTILKTNPIKYDSGVVGVVLPSGLSTVIDNEGNPQWSKGVRMEYEFMQSKHILVITLETALTVPPVQWKEMNI